MENRGKIRLLMASVFLEILSYTSQHRLKRRCKVNSAYQQVRHGTTDTVDPIDGCISPRTHVSKGDILSPIKIRQDQGPSDMHDNGSSNSILRTERCGSVEWFRRNANGAVFILYSVRRLVEGQCWEMT